MSLQLHRKATIFTLLAIAAAGTVVTANADPLTYVIGNNDADGTHHFGTVDLTSGAFHQIGPDTPVGSEGLAAGLGGTLFTIAYDSVLYSINPATGSYTLVGPTGLGDCTTPDSPCGPTSSLTLGGANGHIYATDFLNRIYTVNTLTGGATLIGSTGISPVPAIPGSFNPDGTINFYEEAVFGAGGKLYSTFDAFAFDLATSSPTNIAVAPALYEIDPLSGKTTVVNSTDLAIGAVVVTNGTEYTFNLLKGQILSLDTLTGKTSFVANTDPIAGTIRGAATVTPEPASIVLTGIALAAILVWQCQKRSLSS